jgi:hypothetical protein
MQRLEWSGNIGHEEWDDYKYMCYEYILAVA